MDKTIKQASISSTNEKLCSRALKLYYKHGGEIRPYIVFAVVETQFKIRFIKIFGVLPNSCEANPKLISLYKENKTGRLVKSKMDTV